MLLEVVICVRASGMSEKPVSALLVAEACSFNLMLSHIYLSPAPCHPKGLLIRYGSLLV